MSATRIARFSNWARRSPAAVAEFASNVVAVSVSSTRDATSTSEMQTYGFGFWFGFVGCERLKKLTYLKVGRVVEDRVGVATARAAQLNDGARVHVRVFSHQAVHVTFGPLSVLRAYSASTVFVEHRHVLVVGCSCHCAALMCCASTPARPEAGE